MLPQASSLCRPLHLSSRHARVIDIPKTNVYRFGDYKLSKPIFRDLQWAVNDGEAWAVVGSTSSSKAHFFQTLLGHLRLSPYPSHGLFLESSNVTQASVSFGHRSAAAGGGFYDFSARYGSVHEEDRVTLRQHMFPETVRLDDLPKDVRAFMLERLRQEPVKQQSKTDEMLFEDLVDKMGLRSSLDLPLIALSNGQTRRARILKAVLSKPSLLLLDEPLTGLDVDNRSKLLDLLSTLHTNRSPRLIIGLRTHDLIPDWITHIAFIQGENVYTGPKDAIQEKYLSKLVDVRSLDKPSSSRLSSGAVLADLKNVQVQYADRKVLHNINWQIHEGERWYLQGQNGSGKTTLLSLLTGDHPQSYTQLPTRSSHLQLFSQPRARIPTPHLQSLIGLVSPELFDAFPRRQGMSVRDVVGTGFDGVYVPRGVDSVGTGVMHELTQQDIDWRRMRIDLVLQGLGPSNWLASSASNTEFSKSNFVDLSVGEQRMVLLMRALVGEPRLILLDEVWSGMEEAMVLAARKYLREGGVSEQQAVVVITHWEHEVPWTKEDGLKQFILEKGVGSTR